MKRPVFICLIRNARTGYSLAAAFYLIACALLVAGWWYFGSASAAVAICLTLDTALEHKHLSKRSQEKTDQS
jgi:hypothetical protein